MSGVEPSRRRRIAFARLRAHYQGIGEEVPEDVVAALGAGVALRFHRGRVRESTLERYAARRAEVAGRLEQGYGRPVELWPRNVGSPVE